MTNDPYMQALLAGGSADQPEGFEPQPVPCEIHLKGGGTFKVTDVNAWGYMDTGVFAVGSWQFLTEPQEESVLFPYNSILYISFDFEALERFELEAAAAAEGGSG